MIATEKAAALAASDTGFVQPRWMKVATAVRYSGISRSSLYELLNASKIRSHRVGGTRLIDRDSLDAFISSQPSQAQL